MVRTSATVGSKAGEFGGVPKGLMDWRAGKFGGVAKGLMDWRLVENAVSKLGNAIGLVQRMNLGCSW